MKRNAEIKVIGIHTAIFNGVVETFTENIWIEDKNHPEGGGFQKVIKYYGTPRITGNVVLMVEGNDGTLDIGHVYSDGQNSYIATDDNKVTSLDTTFEKWEYPSLLILIASQHAYVNPHVKKDIK